MFISREKINEISGIIILAFSIILSASLISYDPNDLPFNIYPPNPRIVNYVGIMGAYLADGIFKMLGWTAIFIPFILIYIGFQKFRGEAFDRIYIKTFGIIGFLFTFCCLMWILQIGGQTYRSGGEIGIIGTGILRKLFGALGSYVILFSLLIISFLLLLDNLLLFPLLSHCKNLLYKKKEDYLKWRGDKEGISKKDEGPVINLNTLNVVPAVEDTEERVFEGFAKPKGEKTEVEKAKKIRERKPPEKKNLELLNNEKYELPNIDLLEDYTKLTVQSETREEIEEKSKALQEALKSFGVDASVIQVHQGPVITRYELQPAIGVKVSQIVSLADDISLVLKASPVRIVAPIPGKAAVGVEIPNKRASTVYLKELLDKSEFHDEDSKLILAMGKDISGAPFYFDLTKMPHLLIAGATGSGKSICINAFVMAFLYQSEPSEVKFLIIDPKRVEMKSYQDIPHLLIPVITDVKDAILSLKWAVFEMEERYKIFASVGARDIDSYNKLPSGRKKASGEEEKIYPEKMYYIVIIIDELADLMFSSGNEIEDAITRLAQMARAVGIHLVLATQRPSVDVITGLIKANFPARIAFQVSSKVDSRTILDQNGAEKLLGGGDMLFSPPGSAKPIRLQGCYVSTKEIERVTDFVRSQAKPEYKEDIFKAIPKTTAFENEEVDILFKEAVRVVLESNQPSVSLLQRRLKIGYNRAARLIEIMESEGILGPYEVGKSREILVSQDYWQSL